MPDVIYEMSRKKLGMTTVVEGTTAGGSDQRRRPSPPLENRGKDVLDLTAAECMTRNPRAIGPREFAATALALMEGKKITSLVVVDGNGLARNRTPPRSVGNRDDVASRTPELQETMYHYDPTTALEEITEEALSRTQSTCAT